MDAKRAAFIKKIGNDAVNATIGTGLFASVLIAQACIEGRNGESDLAKKYHNHFGIKASSGWLGKAVDFMTSEYLNGAWVRVKAAFRAYNSLYDGFRDRCAFLISNKRYKSAGVFSAKTPEDQAKALLKAGYATDPKYADTLISVIRTYNLKQYDSLAEQKKNNVAI